MRDLKTPSNPGSRLRHIQLRRTLEHSADPISTAQLAESLGVSVSTIERDVSELRDQGLNIVSTRGRSGGLFLVRSRDQAADSTLNPSQTGFVGRQTELGTVMDHMNGEAINGIPVIAISGESGLGKTRLLDEVGSSCLRMGFQVWRGDAQDRLGSPPLLPWIQVLTDLRESSSNSDQLQKERIDQILADVQDSRYRGTDSSSVEGYTSLGIGQFELFEGVQNHFIDSAASGAAILLDDLHLADASTIDLLEYLASSNKNAKLLIVFTYDALMVSRRSPLRKLLGRLISRPNFTRFRLGPLSPMETHELTEHSVASRLTRQQKELVYERSEGNPLFAKEIIWSLENGTPESHNRFSGELEHQLPEGVRDAASKRLERCSEECVEILAAASVFGRSFELGDLEYLWQKESSAGGIDRREKNPNELIDEAMTLGLIEQGPRIGNYRFTHGLIREVLSDELSLSELIQFNARAGLAKERFYGDGARNHATEIARFFVTSASTVGAEKAARYSVLAGEQCIGVFSFREAEEHFRNALSLRLDHVPGELVWRARLGLGQSLAAALPRARKHEAVSLLSEVVSHYISANRVDLALKAVLTDVVPASTGVEEATDICGMIEKILVLVKSGSLEFGYLQVTYAHALAIEKGQLSEANSAATTALNIGESAGSNDLVLKARRALLAVKFYSGAGPEDEQLARSVVRDAVRSRDVGTELRARFYLVSMLSVASSKTALAEARTFLERAQQFGESSSLQQAMGMTANMLVREGAFSEALELAEKNHSLAGASEWAYAAVYTISANIGRPYTVDQLRDSVVSSSDLPLAIRVQIATSLLLDDRISTDSSFLDAAGSLANDLVLLSRKPRLAHHHQMAALRLGGLVAVGMNDHQRADTSYRFLLQSPDWMHHSDGIHQGQILGRLADFLGIHEVALTHYGNAIEVAQSAQFSPLLAHLKCDLGEKMLEMGNVPNASVLLARAHELGDSLGMTPLLDRLSSINSRIESTGNESNGLPAGLTSREHQVLMLLADGKRNREIAVELVLSERTVQRHIANVYSKIGVRNRAEATAFALSKAIPASEDPD